MPRSLVFQDPEFTNVHAVEAGGGYLWAGCCRGPSLLLRLSPELTNVTPLRFESGSGLHDLAFDGEHLWVAHASGHLSRVAPDTLAYESYALRVPSGQRPFLYCLIFDGVDLWSGTYTEPGCVLLINRETGISTPYVIESARMHSVRTLAAAGESLWVGLYDAPGMALMLDKSTGRQTLLDLGEKNMLITSSAFDGRHVWFGLDSMPAKLVRVDPESHRFEVVSLAEGSSCVRGLVFDGRYLWAGLYTEPGELVRIDPQNGAFETYCMPERFFNVRDLVVHDGRVWAATQNVRYQPSGIYGLELTA